MTHDYISDKEIREKGSFQQHEEGTGNYILPIWNTASCTSRKHSPKLCFYYESTSVIIRICAFISTILLQNSALQLKCKTQSAFPGLIYFLCFSHFINLN